LQSNDALALNPIRKLPLDIFGHNSGGWGVRESTDEYRLALDTFAAGFGGSRLFASVEKLARSPPGRSSPSGALSSFYLRRSAPVFLETFL
jgi:hypothetical protein